MKQLNHWMNSHEIWYWRILRKIVEWVQLWFRSNSFNNHFTWGLFISCISSIPCWIFIRAKTVSKSSYGEKLNTFYTFITSLMVFKIVEQIWWDVKISKFLYSAVIVVSQSYPKLGLSMFFGCLCILLFIRMDSWEYTVYRQFFRLNSFHISHHLLALWYYCWYAACLPHMVKIRERISISKSKWLKTYSYFICILSEL
jgi:hypothetical protein